MLGVFVQIGFGKGTASKQVWLDGIDPSISESQLERNLSKYGKVGNKKFGRELHCKLPEVNISTCCIGRVTFFCKVTPLICSRMLLCNIIDKPG